jgi:hypothetical protein
MGLPDADATGRTIAYAYAYAISQVQHLEEILKILNNPVNPVCSFLVAVRGW